MRCTISLVALALVLVVAFGGSPAQAVCGDVNQDGINNILDAAMIIDYLFTGGTLSDSVAANTDGCPGVDIGDVNVLFGYLFWGLPGPCYDVDCTPVFSGSVELEGVTNGTMSELYVGDTVRLFFRMTVDEDHRITTLSHGFRAYSPDGATWDVIDLRAKEHLDSADFYFFDVIEYPGFPVSGDTVGFGAFGHNGLQLGSYYPAFEIVLGPFDASDAGKTVCIDSTYFGTGDNPWLWCSRDRDRIRPEWNGPYCFTVAQPPETEITLHHVSHEIAPGVVRTEVPVSFDFMYTNNSGESIMGFTNGYRVYSPDGADVSIQSGSAIGNLWTGSIFNDAFVIDYFGPGPDTVGFGGVTIFGDGVPTGTADVAFRLTLNPLEPADDGKQVCVDSSFWPPGGQWMWASSGGGSGNYVPAWDGPHCFEIQYVEDPPVLISVPDSIFITVYENTNDMPYEVIRVETALDTDPLFVTANIVEDFGPFVLSRGWVETPDYLFASAIPQGFAAGRYANTLEFTSDSADNSPQYTIAVLDVLPEPEAGFLVDGFFGTFGQQKIKSSVDCWFDLRMINNSTEVVGGFTNGIEISSPDGATWTTAWADSVPGFTSIFDGGIFLNHFGVDGSGADTLAYGGVTFFADGLVPGGDIEPFSGHFGPITTGSAFKTVCIDSTYYPPAGTWLWGTMGGSGQLVPDWNGQQCYEVYIPTNWITIEGGGSLVYTTEVGVDVDVELFIDSHGGLNPADYFAISYVPWFQPRELWWTPPEMLRADILVAGMDTGTYHGQLLIEAPEAWNTPWLVDLTLNIVPAGQATDSLVIPSSVATGVCGQTQEVAIKAEQPLKGAAIPIAIPEGAAVTEVSFEGLLTETWDFNFIEINNEQGFVFVALANSSGAVIPDGLSTVFTMTFDAGTAECMTTSAFHWDTTLSNDPSRALLFADVNNMDVQPGFDALRDSAVVPGYRPGDIDGDDIVNITDLTGLIGYMFDYGAPPCVLNATDCNGSCTGPNIADMTYLVDYLFQEGAEPVCGCLNKMAAPKLWAASSVGVVYEDGVSIVMLSSDIDLRGLQLEISGVTGRAVSLLSEDFDVLQRLDNGILTLGLLDLKGENVIAAGEHRLVRIDGKCEIASALGSDSRHEDVLLSVGERSAIPTEYGLQQNYPNPFNPSTEISFTLAEAGHVRLDVFNVMGQKVATLIDGYRERGPHSVMWNGRTGSGDMASSGVYFYRLESGTFADTRKMILLK